MQKNHSVVKIVEDCPEVAFIKFCCGGKIQGKSILSLSSQFAPVFELSRGWEGLTPLL
jgi:hypothetical protein